MLSSAPPMTSSTNFGLLRLSSRLMTGTRSSDFIDRFLRYRYHHGKRLPSTFLPLAKIFDDGRHERDGDDGEDDELEILLDDGDVAEEIPGGDEEADPQGRAEDVVSREDRVRHRADAGHERRERPDDRDEARQHDRLGAVLLVIAARLVDVRLLDGDAEELPEFGARADLASDAVVHGVAGDRGPEQQPRDDPRVERPGGGGGSRRQKERVAGQDGRRDQPRLAEEDEEQDGVNPSPVSRDGGSERLVEMEEEVEEFRHAYVW